MTTTENTCVVCESRDIEIFIEIPQVPVYCNVLYHTREEAIRAPKADMKLGFCRACGHIYNFAFDPDKLDYTQEYENSLHHSPRFQEYATSLATQLIERHNLYNKDIIEIGCGSGDFLKLLCELGGNRGVGFDPSGAHDKKSMTNDKRITFIHILHVIPLVLLIFYLVDKIEDATCPETCLIKAEIFLPIVQCFLPLIDL